MKFYCLPSCGSDCSLPCSLPAEPLCILTLISAVSNLDLIFQPWQGTEHVPVKPQIHLQYYTVKTQITIGTVPAMKTWTHTGVILMLWFYSVRKDYLMRNQSLFKDITALSDTNSYHYDYNNKDEARSPVRQNISLLSHALHLSTFTSITVVKISSWLRKKEGNNNLSSTFAESTVPNYVYTHPNYPSVLTS